MADQPALNVSESGATPAVAAAAPGASRPPNAAVANPAAASTGPASPLPTDAAPSAAVGETLTGSQIAAAASTLNMRSTATPANGGGKNSAAAPGTGSNAPPASGSSAVPAVAPKNDGKGTPAPAGGKQATTKKLAEKDKPAEDAATEESLAGSKDRLAWLRVLPSWLISLLIHMTMLFGLALIVDPVKLIKEANVDLVATDAEAKPGNLDELPPDLPTGALDVDQPDGLAEALSLSSEANGADISTLNELPAAPAGISEMGTSVGLAAAPILDLGKALGGGGAGGLMGGQGLDGRGDGARKALAMERGGSEGSENAVGSALAWIAHHQNPDGSWSFDHRKGPCQNRCGNAGRMEHGEIAATAIALLPFLGAGQTHTQGKYKKTVQAGLYYLVNRMKITPDGGDLSYDQGVMYGHGLAAIALCEAYGMTKDAGLAVPAQHAINFIVYAQDPVGGGWRYAPHQPGDTSVVGWQLMALKSAHMAYLNVPPKTIKGAVNFLNSVQKDSGAAYGYVNPGNGAATTAIGLLCRMYLGWKHDEPALERGVELLAKHGPSPNNMYFNYYATQVLHHYEGPLWNEWNKKMRDALVNSQSRSGHEQGSWYFGGDHSADQGGRLYTTAMAAMTLEVYYRHLPIYRKDSTASDFDE